MSPTLGGGAAEVREAKAAATRTGTVLVYANRRHLWALIVFFAAYAVGVVIVLINHHGFDNLSGRTWKFLLVAVLLPIGAWRVTRGLTEPRPALAFTTEALEGDFGRIRWRDVQGFELDRRWSFGAATSYLVITPKPGARVEPIPTEYSLRFNKTAPDSHAPAAFEATAGSLDRKPKALVELATPYIARAQSAVPGEH